MNLRPSPPSLWPPAVLMLALALSFAAATRAETREELRRFALELVNNSRAEHGVPPLRLAPELSQAAQAHAEDMLRRNYFAHESPEGGTAMDRYRAAGGSPGKLVAENIAQCRNCAPGRKLVEGFHSGWMKSPGHRANILAPGVDRFGFDIAAAGQDVTAVQTFAGAGAPGDGAEGGAPRALDAPGQLAVALDLVNAARAGAGREPLQPSPALSDALRNAAEAADMAEAELSLPPLSELLSSLPADERSRLKSATLMGGQCGGCGREPTDADIRFFVERWLADPDYKSALLDPGWSDLGITVLADGGGSKRALLILAGP
jgi:uncharacterized protein YkwD